MHTSSSIYLAIFFFLFSSCINTDQEPQTYYAKRSLKKSAFEFYVTITERTNSFLKGYYCGYYSDNSFFDCGLEGEEGTKFESNAITNNSYQISFTSSYSGLKGEAIITIKDASIYWEFLSAHKINSQYEWIGVPDTATMYPILSN